MHWFLFFCCVPSVVIMTNLAPSHWVYFFMGWPFSLRLYFMLWNLEYGNFKFLLFWTFDQLVVLFMPNYSMLLSSRHIKHWLEMASAFNVTATSFWWGLNKRFNFLWRRSNHWDGSWEKRVACLMGSVLFSSNLVTLDFFRSFL